jgi:hypothetical protein
LIDRCQDVKRGPAELRASAAVGVDFIAVMMLHGGLPYGNGKSD